MQVRPLQKLNTQLGGSCKAQTWQAGYKAQSNMHQLRFVQGAHLANSLGMYITNDGGETLRLHTPQQQLT